MSATRARIVSELEAGGVVAIIRLTDGGEILAVAEALRVGGVRAIEVTMTVPGAVGLIEALAATLPPGVLIGAGTVLDADTARAVIRAGASFIVSPVFRPALIDVGHAHDVAVLPGCFTPTEILNGWDAGADLVKVFPSTALGPGFIRDVRGPLPHIRLMPTGGVTRENAGEWIRAGAVAIGVGTALVDAATVAARRFDVIRDRGRAFVEAVAAARGTQTAGARA